MAARKIPAKWTKVVDAEILQRSSQVLSVVGGLAYVFGGELRPREPRDNDMHVVALGVEDVAPTVIPATTTTAAAAAACPSPRVGSASTTLKQRLYIFSGRGGVAMAPVEEHGAVWEFDPVDARWSALQPCAGSPVPPARSYHCMASDGKDTIYLHAGCPEKGRLSDLWSFSLSTRRWRQLAAAPDPPRGGASIAVAADDDGLLYRMNGFDGTSEQGGSVDVYSPATDSWLASHVFPADGRDGPEPRSVSALVPVRIAGRASLVTMFGERDPSNLGHQGAGKMLSDVWAFDLQDRVWAQVDARGESGSSVPAARGWFAADVTADGKIVVQGGLDELNARLGDLWVLSF